MASNKDLDPQTSSSSQTPRSGLGTQPRQCYSARELGTPSGEVIFNFSRRNEGQNEEDQANLPLGGKSSGESSAREASRGFGKSPWSNRMGRLSDMLDSVGSLRNEIAGQMTTLNNGSEHEMSCSRGDGEYQPRFDEESASSTRERRIVREISGSRTLTLGEVEDCERPAKIPTARGGRVHNFTVEQDSNNWGDFWQRDAPGPGRSKPDNEAQTDRSRNSQSRVGIGGLPLYRPRTNNLPSSQPPLRTSHKKPANYDGTTSFQDYLVQFEMTSELNKWDETTKAMELATSLRGAAQSILGDLRPAQYKDYEYLVSVLTDRFEPLNQTELYRAQIKGRLRKKSETVQELAQDIKRLVRRAYPQAAIDLRDQIARDCFIDALNEHELEWFVYQGKPKTVDEATQLALEYEAFQSGRKRSVMVRQCSKGDNSDTDPLTKITEQIQKLQTEMEKIKEKSSKGIICHSCGERGHTIIRCPKNNNQQNHPYNRYHNNNNSSYQNRGNNNRYTNGNRNSNNQGNSQ